MVDHSTLKAFTKELDKQAAIIVTLASFLVLALLGSICASTSHEECLPVRCFITQNNHNCEFESTSEHLNGTCILREKCSRTGYSVCYVSPEAQTFGCDVMECGRSWIVFGAVLAGIGTVGSLISLLFLMKLPGFGNGSCGFSKQTTGV